MTFDVDALVVEEASRGSALANRLVRGLGASVPVTYVSDAHEATRAMRGADPLGAGKRRLVVRKRRAPFLMGCPAGSAQFACCGYLVLILASNCPMDCSYCFLQEHVANNPAFQIYSNFRDSFEEMDRLAHSAPGRHFLVGTGELADSLDPRGRALVSWTRSPDTVWKSSEHRTASPSARIAAARAVLDGGYRVGFHFDPMIVYEGAERDYLLLVDQLLSAIPAGRISLLSMGALRMTPELRSAARRRSE